MTPPDHRSGRKQNVVSRKQARVLVILTSRFVALELERTSLFFLNLGEMARDDTASTPFKISPYLAGHLLSTMYDLTCSRPQTFRSLMKVSAQSTREVTNFLGRWARPRNDLKPQGKVKKLLTYVGTFFRR
ncbi:hypothetical protein AVEN_7738-1 [Araneus ventricosus]|uniref:Uncharacterized protein n=1 Tax=Araneus ventricosus TaxID=182803 RepID=A0A4Y2RTF8_ARAVE|nr:hypothetical protein AVEN_7738-1 [Araneus ventricosus]